MIFTEAKSAKRAACTSQKRICTPPPHVDWTMGDYYMIKLGSIGFSPGGKCLQEEPITHEERNRIDDPSILDPRVPLPRRVGSKQTAKPALPSRKKKKKNRITNCQLPLACLPKRTNACPFPYRRPQTAADGRGQGEKISIIQYKHKLSRARVS